MRRGRRLRHGGGGWGWPLPALSPPKSPRISLRRSWRSPVPNLLRRSRSVIAADAGERPFPRWRGAGRERERNGNGKTNCNGGTNSSGGRRGRAASAPLPHAPPGIGETSTPRAIDCLPRDRERNRSRVVPGYQLLVPRLRWVPAAIGAFSWLPYTSDSGGFIRVLPTTAGEEISRKRFKGPLHTEECSHLPAEPSSAEAIARFLFYTYHGESKASKHKTHQPLEREAGGIHSR